MELLNLETFKKVYPHLTREMYKILNIEYPNDIQVPIDMEDASLADTFFAKYQFDKKIEFGKKKAKMIIELVKTQPQMEKWLDILYPNRVEIVKSKYRKKHQIIEKEIILYVFKKGKAYLCKDKNGNDYTDQINQGKLNYAYLNNGVIRGRLIKGNKKYVWRAVKKKFVEKPRVTLEEIEQKLTSESNNKVRKK
jgi:hypothetical protein